ncbi:LUD domain-containing protein [Amycolatopsis rubida]|uniref:Uncharacterized ACR, YkgG family COG1556 n=1 Tax=Amycolatopsis rubida TaxID=112413 RepID=A0A1I5KFP0_9PSEU|nr:LUD domain-containing protein [Amycolatopsis rubida]SFO83829.1 Uncharacterised ACR, YkgG family COG1556 [Amycolatopsis rubida]
MTAIDGEARFTALPAEQTLIATVTALEEHGFGVEVVDDFESARLSVLNRIPHGSTVMTNTSATLRESGIEAAINDPDGPYVSARNRMMTLDFRTQQQEMKAIAGQADYALGSVHAITADGTVVIASATGSQLAAYVWDAPNVILVAGTQKLVPSLRAAHERIVEHSLKLEDVRARAAYGQHSYIGKLLEVRQEQPGRIHLVLIRRNVGF